MNILDTSYSSGSSSNSSIVDLVPQLQLSCTSPTGWVGGWVAGDVENITISAFNLVEVEV